MAVRRALIGFIMAFAVATGIAALTTARKVHHTSALPSPVTQI